MVDVADEWWTALRCSGAKTTQLVRKLVENKIEAWTPVRISMRRLPRKNVKQEVVVPMLPSFVFVRVDDLVASIWLSECRMCPAFTPMTFMGKLAQFKGRQLLPMKVLYDDNPLGVENELPSVGSVVVLRFGMFSGLRGIVRGYAKKQCLVEIDNNGINVKISPFFLEKVGL